MLIMFIILAVIFAVMGFLVRRYPDLINHVRSLDQSERQMVDIPALQRAMSRTMLLAALAFAVFAVISVWYHGRLMIMAMLSIVAVISVAMVLQSKKYDFRPNSSRRHAVAMIATVLVVIGVGVLIYYSSRPSQVDIAGDRVEISGMYGVTIQLASIDSVYVTDRIPRVKIRTNGYSDGTTLRGYFKVEQWGRCLFHIQDINAPMVVIVGRDGNHVVYNSDNANTTSKVYKMIADRLK